MIKKAKKSNSKKISQINTGVLVLENKNLLEKLLLKEENIKALKEERELIINAKSLKDVGLSSKEARHKINELIRGIDKCIAQLNL